MSAFVEHHVVDRYPDGNVRIRLQTHDGSAYYFEVSDADASKLASDLSMVAHGQEATHE